MALEVDGLCNAEPGERSEDRTNHRNGDRDRRWETRVGTIDLKLPKLQGQLFAVLPGTAPDGRTGPGGGAAGSQDSRPLDPHHRRPG